MPVTLKRLSCAPGSRFHHGQGLTQISWRHAKSVGQEGFHLRKKCVSTIELVYSVSPGQFIHGQAITFQAFKLVLYSSHAHVVKRRDFTGVALAACNREQ